MNYYERFCGDYQRDTAHLSLVEHGVYTQLLDTYYATEMPLPAEMARLYRVCRAVTADEQTAVQYVVEQYFPIGDDGLRHNARADEEISKARRRIDAARTNGQGGGRPSRKPPGNPPGNPPGLPTGNPPGNPPGLPTGNPPGPDPPNPAGTQRGDSPYPIPHTPGESTLAGAFSARATPAGEACRRLKAEAGVTDVNPSHGQLLQVLAAGATPQQLVDVALEKRATGTVPRFAYVLSTMAGRLADEKGRAPIPKAQPANVFAGAK